MAGRGSFLDFLALSISEKSMKRHWYKREQLLFFDLLFGEVVAFQAGCRHCALGDISAGLRL